MMRASVIMRTGLVGNGVIGIRREDKNVWERRTPLSPGQVKALIGRGLKVIVQPSSTRCFDNESYEEVGAEINEDLSGASTIVAVKEVPADLLIPERTYMFFSHTIKAQPYNMPLLDTILQKNIRLLDYERIVGPDGRVVKFGPYAGFAGMVDTLHALGIAMLMRGYATPFLHLSLSKEYNCLETVRKELLDIGDQIRKRGLPEEVCPMTIAVTGTGSVSLATQQMLHLLPCKYVEVEDLPALWNRKTKDRHHIYVTVVTSKDMVQPKDSAKRFDKREYYTKPDDFVPVFHDRVAPYTRVLMNCMYWEPRFPRLLSTNQAKELQRKGNLPMLAMGDITCDPGGSVEFFVKSTEIQNPLYAYDLNKEQVIDLQDYSGDGVLVLGVDHLPAEFPAEASRSFGSGLAPLVEIVAKSDGTKSLEVQKEDLGTQLFNAMITNRGALTPNFEYITAMRAANEGKKRARRNVLVIGAGMTAGVAVRHLLQDPLNNVTVVDADEKALSALKRTYADAMPGLNDSGKRALRTAKADCTKMDTHLKSLIKDASVLLSLAPASMHAPLLKQAIEYDVPACTASYISAETQELDEVAKEKDVPIINELGLDPGIDIMTSARLLDEIRREGGIVKKYTSICGALPAPEHSDCPMGYKFSWSPRGVLVAATRPARFLAGGEYHNIPGNMLYEFVRPYPYFKGVKLHVVPNGNVENYAKLFKLDEATDVMRGTFRYDAFAPMVRAFYALGLLDPAVVTPEAHTENTTYASWANLMGRLVGAEGSGDLPNAVAQFLTKKLTDQRKAAEELSAWQALFGKDLRRAPIEEDVTSIMMDLTALGLLSESEIIVKNAKGFALDSLCAAILPKLKYRGHERDFNLMIHRVVAEYPSVRQRKVFTSTMALRGFSGTESATSVTVGTPAAIGAQLLLDSQIPGKGLLRPSDPTIYTPVLRELEKAGIRMVEDCTTTTY